MKNILVTEFNGSGDNVMLFTNLDAKDIKNKLEKQGAIFGEIYEVPEKELSFYLYEPLWLDEKTEKVILSA